MTYLYCKFETTEIIGPSLSSAYLWSGKEMITIHSYKYSKQIEELQTVRIGAIITWKGRPPEHKTTLYWARCPGSRHTPMVHLRRTRREYCHPRQ